MYRFSFAPTVLAIAFVLPACAAGNAFESVSDDSSVPGEIESAFVAPGRTGLSPACFWHDNTQMSLRVYGAQSLVEDGILRPPHVLPNGCGDVPSYVVRCALPRGATVEVASGETYEGEFGLAPNWMNAKLSSDEQRWITACLLQHVSDQKDVPFALEGRHSAFVKAPAALDTESMVLGNLFTGGTGPIGGAAFQAEGCTEEGLVNVCGSDAQSALLQRVCGNSSKCGLKVLGSCADACKFDDSGNVVECFGQVSREIVGMRIDDAAMGALHGVTCE